MSLVPAMKFLFDVIVMLRFGGALTPLAVITPFEPTVNITVPAAGQVVLPVESRPLEQVKLPEASKLTIAWVHLLVLPVSSI